MNANTSILTLPGKVTPTYLELPQKLNYDEWRDILLRVKVVNDASRFWMGDCYMYGEKHYGEQYAQALSDTGVNEETQKRYYFVSSAISPRIRIPELSWSHHRIVAYADIDGDEKEVWLKAARKQEWTVRELVDALVKAGKRAVRVKRESEDEAIGESTDAEVCNICHESEATSKVCETCLESIAAMPKERFSKEHSRLLAWAAKYVKPPGEFVTANQEKEWRDHFNALTIAASQDKHPREPRRIVVRDAVPKE